MSGLNRQTRLQIMLNENELEAIDDWRYAQRMPSRAAAIRKLIHLGLRAQKGQTDPSLRSGDFGVISDGRDM